MACITFSKLQLSFHHYRETRMLLHAKWSNLQNTQQNTQPNSTKFSAMSGEDEKNDTKILHSA